MHSFSLFISCTDFEFLLLPPHKSENMVKSLKNRIGTEMFYRVTYVQIPPNCYCIGLSCGIGVYVCVCECHVLQEVAGGAEHMASVLQGYLKPASVALGSCCSSSSLMWQWLCCLCMYCIVFAYTSYTIHLAAHPSTISHHWYRHKQVCHLF